MKLLMKLWLTFYYANKEMQNQKRDEKLVANLMATWGLLPGKLELLLVQNEKRYDFFSIYFTVVLVRISSLIHFVSDMLMGRLSG